MNVMPVEPIETRNPRPSRRRLAAVIGGTLLLHAGIVVLVARGGAAAHRSAPAVAVALASLAVLGGVVSALLMGAVGEWLVHRFLMHRPWKPRLLRAIYDLHHRGHHYIHFTPARYVHDGPINYVPVLPPQPEALCDSAWGRFLSMGAQVVFYGTVATVAVLLPTALAARDALFTATFTATLAVEIFLFVRLHDAVHYPGQTGLDRLPFFERLDRHHYLHHIDPNANTNFLLPLGDWLFGTLRKRPTAWERARFPSYEQARRTVIVDGAGAAGGRRAVGGAA